MKRKRKGIFLYNEIDLSVRFSEVDSMGIVWHGNYWKYFEDAREALGKPLEMGYMDVYDNGYMIPLVHADIDYKMPVRYRDQIKVKVWLKKEDSAKIIYEYEIWNLTTNQMACTGRTIQAFIDLEGELQLVIPEFYETWKSKQDWKEI